MKITLPSSVTRKFYKIGFALKKHSPEILVIAGVAGTVATTVVACKATTKAGAIIEEHKKKMNDIHEAAALGDKAYTEKDQKKDTVAVYTQTAVNFAKLYGPSVLLGTVSITSILAGTNIFKKRNVALAAAYATVDKGFKEYRERVVERFGKEIDKELKYNIKAQEIEEKVTDKKGHEKVEKTIVETAELNDVSDYARFFDESCAAWTKDPEENLIFLKLQQSYANKILQQKGYIFLNDVYKLIGLPATKAGQAVGWIYDESGAHGGDNYVDFGIYDINNRKKREFVNGAERSILLDFNVDGDILDML